MPHFRLNDILLIRNRDRNRDRDRDRDRKEFVSNTKIEHEHDYEHEETASKESASQSESKETCRGVWCIRPIPIPIPIPRPDSESRQWRRGHHSPITCGVAGTRSSSADVVAGEDRCYVPRTGRDCAGDGSSRPRKAKNSLWVPWSSRRFHSATLAK